jgi:WD40 repeat protein
VSTAPLRLRTYWLVLALAVGCSRKDPPAEQPAPPGQPADKVVTPNPPGPAPVDGSPAGGPAAAGQLLPAKRDVPLDGSESVLALGPGGATAAVRTRARIELRDLGTGKAKQTIPVADHQMPNRGAFSPDGTRLAYGVGLLGVNLVDTAAGKPVTLETNADSFVSAVAFRPDGKRLAAGAGFYVRVWDLTATPPRRLEFPGDRGATVGVVAFSPDGAKIAVGADSALALIDAESGKPLWRVPAQDARVAAVSFSADGSRVLTAADGRDTTARLWSAADGKELAAYRHTAFTVTAWFSPDGRTVLTATDDGMLHAWDADTGKRIGSRQWREGDRSTLDRAFLASAARGRAHLGWPLSFPTESVQRPRTAWRPDLSRLPTGSPTGGASAADP